MALATPVLERTVKTEDKLHYDNFPVLTDEEHNARIKSNYAMLINPAVKVDEVLGRNSVSEIEPAVRPVRKELFAQQPVLVENARADAAIFRADNPVNRMAALQPVVAEISEDEENEDLVPTRTTIQYKTTDIAATVEEGKISNKKSTNDKLNLSKKEKIIIAVVVSVIVALFALIIINSAIISNINADLGSLQSSLATVKAAYSGVSDEINGYLSDSERLAAEFAILNNMILG